MTRMRDSMPVILFGLLIAFLITIIFEWGMDYLGTAASRSDVIGEVNGQKISFREFSELLKNVTDNQRSQTGSEPDENALRQSREQTWQSLVTQRLLDQKIEELGITVTDQELVDWVRGENPPEDLRRNFIDSTGVFRKDLYDEFLGNPNRFIQDPQGLDQAFGSKWLADYEKSLRQRRKQEKLQSLVLSTVRVTESEVFSRFSDQNQRYEATYALFDANTAVKDADVEISESDLKAYYNENLEQYKTTASRSLKYVQFLEQPSGADSLALRNEIEDVRKKAESGIDFLELVYTYSVNPDSGAFFKHGELSPEIERPAFAAKVGDLVGPILDARGYHLLKVLDERKSADEFVYASHILLTFEGKDSNEVKAAAQRILKDARDGKDFAGMARQFSEDKASGERGGDLGWFGKGRMVKPFEDASMSAKPGTVVGPVRSPFGLHIIKVHARDARELKLVSVILPIEPSSQTKNDLFERARDFAYNARETEFTKEVQATGLEAKEVQVQETAGGMIPGLGIHERASRWAFEGKLGGISEPFVFPNGYVVFTITEIKDAGIRPFDEVKESIRPLALRKKKIKKAMQMAGEAKASLSAGDKLESIAASHPAARVASTGQFSLASAVPALGRDLAFIGAISAMEVGQISPPVESQRGAFLIHLTAKSPVDSAAYLAQKESLRTQILQEKRNRFLTEWVENLKQVAKIEDYRDDFYR